MNGIQEIFLFVTSSAFAGGLVIGWMISSLTPGNNGDAREDIKIGELSTFPTPLNDGEDFVD